MNETKGILVFANEWIRGSVEEAQKSYPAIFAAYWSADFAQVFQKNIGNFHVVAISCEENYIPRKMFDLVAQSGFQGKVYTLIPITNGNEDNSEHEWPTKDIWFQEMFRMFAFRQME